MKTIVNHFDFDSSIGEVVIQIIRLPDSVMSDTRWNPNPKDLPADFKRALRDWLKEE